MSQSGVARVSASVLPPSVPLQFTGDNGTIAIPAGNNITIFASNTTQGAGSTVLFANSGSTSQLNLSDGRSNTILGSGAGNATLTGTNNSSVGSGALAVLTIGQFNAALGFESLFGLTTGSSNTAIGFESLFSLKTGSDNIAIGSGAGSNYVTSESRNICIGETGTPGDNGVIRIGIQGAFFQTKCFIAGITGVAVANAQLVTINSATQQLGVVNISNLGAVTTLTGNTGGAISPVAGNINTVGTGSITIAGSGSTLTTQLTGLTNHALQVGAGTATLTQLANGTTGQVLTAVTGADPVWAAAASSFAPNATIQLADDFIGVNNFTRTTITSNYSWSQGGGIDWLYGTTIGDSGHNGVITNNTFASTNSANIFLNDFDASIVSPQMILGGGAITLNWVFKTTILSTGAIRYIIRCGLGDTPRATQVNGVYFEYSDNVNSGNWQYVTANASTRTTSNSAVAANTNYHNFQIVINAAGTSCAFSIDGVSLGTANTTNIPTLAVTPFFMCQGSVGSVAASTMRVDLFYMTQTLTTPR